MIICVSLQTGIKRKHKVRHSELDSESHTNKEIHYGGFEFY